MNLTTSKTHLNSAFTDIQDMLSASTLEELNIYNQAYLELNQPLVKNIVFHKNTKHELPIVFNIEGDISGQAICLLDTYNKSLQNDSSDFFMSLYVESMNILLGKMLTNLESRFSLTGIISSPVKPKEGFWQTYDNHSKRINLLSMGYKFISNTVEYDCRIIFRLNKRKYIEV